MLDVNTSASCVKHTQLKHAKHDKIISLS